MYEECKKDDLVLANQLITNGADVNQRFNGCRTPLMIAVINNSINVATTLIVHGADVNEINNSLTAIDYATRADIIQLLLDNGVDVTIDHFIRQVRNRYYENVEYLLQRKPGLAFDVEYYGNTAFMHAAEEFNINMMQLLLAYNADVNAKNDSGETALFLVVYKNRSFGSSEYTETIIGNTLRFLIGNGINVNEKNNRGETALMVAAKRYNNFEAKVLVDNGADKNVVDNNNNRACDYCKDSSEMTAIVCPTYYGYFKNLFTTRNLGGKKKKTTKKSKKH
jgi:ankyrin repeat protein